MSELIDLVGQKFSRLSVLHRCESNADGRAWWCCVCDCGTMVDVKGTRLRKGLTKSCGCLKRDMYKDNSKHFKLVEGRAAMNALRMRYRWGAKKRGLCWALSDDHFETLTSAPCYYCGVPPSQVYSGKSYNGSVVYNGIDRTDNLIGYTIGNCVSCCGVCNRAKDTMTLEEFRSWADNVCRHLHRND